MPEYKNPETVAEALERFNKRVLNAGYSFKVRSIDKDDVYVVGSFDFAYYINVHIEFRGIVYTNLKEEDSWWDAWHDDQLFLLTEDEIKKILSDQRSLLLLRKVYLDFYLISTAGKISGRALLFVKHFIYNGSILLTKINEFLYVWPFL